MFQVGIKWYKKRKFGMCNPKQNIFERIFSLRSTTCANPAERRIYPRNSYL